MLIMHTGCEHSCQCFVLFIGVKIFQIMMLLIYLMPAASLYIIFAPHFQAMIEVFFFVWFSVKLSKWCDGFLPLPPACFWINACRAHSHKKKPAFCSKFIYFSDADSPIFLVSCTHAQNNWINFQYDEYDIADIYWCMPSAIYRH